MTINCKLITCLLLTIATSAATAQDQAAFPGSASDQSARKSRSEEQEKVIRVHELMHISAQDVMESLRAIFANEIQAGDLLISAENRGNRLVVRCGVHLMEVLDQLILELDQKALNENVDAVDQAKQSASPSPNPISELNAEQQQIIQKIKESPNERTRAKLLREQLLPAIQRDFATQQQELRTEVASLKARVEALERLLAKRQQHEDEICLKRAEALLADGSGTSLQRYWEIIKEHEKTADQVISEASSNKALQASKDATNPRDVCLVNDSHKTTIFTVISGSEEPFERVLKPHTHSFVRLPATFDDRVVFARTVEDSNDPTKGPSRIVNVATIQDQAKDRWSFCYVHAGDNKTLSMDLLGWVCLDVVPLSWQGTTVEDSQRSKEQLLNSLKGTTEVDSVPDSQLKKFLPFAGTGEKTPEENRP